MVQTWWILNGFAHGLAAYLILRVSVFGYREHAYLYQFGKGNRRMEHSIDMLVPLIRRLSGKIRRYMSWLAKNLARNGKNHPDDPCRFAASQLLFSTFMLLFSYVLLCVILSLPSWIPFLLSGVTALTPVIKLADQAAMRSKSANRDLPFFIDYMTLAMDAGLDFGNALAAVVADAPDSPLKQEFQHLQGDLRLGMSREEGLDALQQRLGSPDLRQVCQTIIQALLMGSNVNQTLKAISENLITKRFLLAEETAGKISVRMMIPMLLFVIPSAMLILLGPLLLEWFTTVG